MKCSKCGAQYTEKPRFCTRCGSYFIDADDPLSGTEWRGVIRADGTLVSDAKVSVTRTKAAAQAGKKGENVSKAYIVWNILAVVFAGIAVFFCGLAALVEAGISLLALGPFIFSLIVTTRKASGKMKLIAGFLLLAAFILFFISFMRS